MRFDIITIFPKIFDAYFSESIIKRAQAGGFVDIDIHNLRDYAPDKHKTVDDTPYGGGAGMVLKVEPIYGCLKAIKGLLAEDGLDSKTKIILFSAKGKRYTQRDAERLAGYGSL
ncbi:MAG: tRNA (guanosine(37)-N1)-methyltransferase TrmD, partial [Candidatus Moranbacteria bacterium]|nr:tRNA (guanosine(37)-N1)-methyltransferase TrmD [Candidatus Moranbacteria bacterium]